MRRPLVLSWSGGKDAAWTLHVLRTDPAFEVVGLVTTVTSGYDRIAMHGIRRDLLHAQAEAAGLPVIEATIPPQCDNAVGLSEAHRGQGMGPDEPVAVPQAACCRLAPDGRPGRHRT